MLRESRIEPITEAGARDLLHEVAAELASQRERLVALREALPVSPREDVMLLGEEDPDFPTEARRTIDCALVDHLEPLIRMLRTAADYKPGEEDDPPDSPPCPRCNSCRKPFARPSRRAR